MKARAVVVATGGASYPKTGSTGDGYAMAHGAGHTIAPPEPALSALVTDEKWVTHLQGLSLRNVTATLLRADQDSDRPAKVASEFGEMLFTHFGISGPIILTLSRSARRCLREGRAYVSIDLKPALSEEKLHARLIRDFRKSRHLGSYLRDLLPRLMAELFPYLAGIDADKPVNTITVEERARLVRQLKDLRVTVTRLAPLEEAIVTSGGVPVSQIDSRTMISTLVRGLFFAGEVIDIDAETGGFNLQAAFSTGFVAGESAAEFAMEDENE